MNLYAEKVSLSFAQGLFTKTAPKGSVAAPKFNCQLLLTPGYKLFEITGGKKVQISPADILAKEAKAVWGEKAMQMLKTIEKSKVCLRNGDDNLTASGDIREGYAGLQYFALKNTKKPTVVNRDRSPITEEDNLVSSGCIVNAFFEVNIQKEPTKKSIYGTIKGVQYVSEGTGFGGGNVASATSFDVIEDNPYAEAAAE